MNKVKLTFHPCACGCWKLSPHAKAISVSMDSGTFSRIAHSLPSEGTVVWINGEAKGENLEGIVEYVELVDDPGIDGDELDPLVAYVHLRATYRQKGTNIWECAKRKSYTGDEWELK